jgi:2,4-dienoyl-CoA reductase-like NADH-dependent reductase (Old Yellow Enzyme family)
LASFALGGPGLIFVEATAVSPEGRISIGCTGLWNDQQMRAFAPIVNFAHAMKVPIGIQLGHAGRKGSTMPPWAGKEFANVEEGGWQSVGASAIPYENFPAPRRLSTDEITEIVKEFSSAAARAVKAGFDVIELHSGYGYLLHQFISPVTNTRDDAYGGDFLGRTKILIDIVNAIRLVIPTGMPLFVRIPATDWITGAWDLQDAVALSKILRSAGVDLIDVVSGGITASAWGETTPGFHAHFSEEIGGKAEILTATGGGISEPTLADKITNLRQADAIMIGTAMLRNPRWSLLAAEELGSLQIWPVQFQRAFK